MKQKVDPNGFEGTGSVGKRCLECGRWLVPSIYKTHKC